MGYGRAISKAVKQAGKQQQANTRGLSGNRNAQGDFMTGENQLDTDRFAASEMMARDKITDSVTPDIQNYIDDVKSQIDEIDNRYEELYNAELQGADDASGSIVKEMEALEAQKEDLLVDLMDKLTSEGVEVPPGLQEMLMDSLTRGERRAFDVAEDDTAKKLSTGEYEIDPMPKFL